MVKAGKHGLLFEPIDEKGWPIAVRVGRHTSALLQVAETWGEDHPDKRLVVTGVPKYGSDREGRGPLPARPGEGAPGRIAYK